MKRVCTNCGKKLKASEAAANYNNEWFACFPCWDKSEGFSGWLEGKGTLEETPHLTVLVPKRVIKRPQ